ncbi:MAG: DUF5801 repeats-in-toxin domain-containing protein, partial [Halioglobus sp.]
TANATADIGTSLTFGDDGPSITAEGTIPALNVDETNLGINASASFAGVFTPDFGADGEGTTVYALDVSAAGVASGLVDTATNESVILTVNGAVVEGRTETSDDLVFTVAVDAAGSVTLDQIRAVKHADTTDHDDDTTLSASDLVTLTATITDGDGDTANATADIGTSLTFGDDGPTANADLDSVVEGGEATGNVLDGLDVDTDADSNSSDGTADMAGADGGLVVVGVRAAGDDVSTEVTNGTTVVADIAGTLTLLADGDYRYVSNPNTIPPDEDQVFVYTVQDGDGDRSTTTLTIEREASDLKATDDNLVVDEAGLDGIGSAALTDVEKAGGTVVGNVTGGTGAYTYALQGVGVTGTPDPDVFTQDGLYGTLTFNQATGAYEYELTDAYEHTPGVSDGPNTVFDLETFEVEAEDGDGNKVTIDISVDITDDVPSDITPTTGLAINKAGGADHGVALDLDVNTDNNVGADQPGTLTFATNNGTAVLASFFAVGDEPDDRDDVQLTSSRDEIWYYTSADGKTLYGATQLPSVGYDGLAPPTGVVFTVELSGGGTTYDFDIVKPIDPRVEVFTSTDTDIFDPKGGNSAYVYFDAEEGGPNPDILLTPLVLENGETVPYTTVNNNDFQVGVNNGPSIPTSEGIRINYTSADLEPQAGEGIPSGGGPNGGYRQADNRNHFFSENFLTNNAFATFNVDGGNGTISFTPYLEDEGENDSNPDHMEVGDKVAVEVKTVVIDSVQDGQLVVAAVGYDGAAQPQTTVSDSYTIEWKFEDDAIDGDLPTSFNVIGVDTGDKVAVISPEDYHAIEYVNLGDPDIALTGFGATSPGAEEAITFPSQELILTDADGDTAAGTITLNLVVGDTDEVHFATDGDDDLAGMIGQTDVFAWKLADSLDESGGNDTITNFTVADNDVLDLRDLLQGENEANLDDYLQVTSNGTDTVTIDVSSGGDAPTFDQTITISSVELAEDLLGMSSSDAIAQMLANQQIITDL